MKVYDGKGLQEVLMVGKDTAYRIMRDYGFRTGYTNKSPLRITEEGVQKYVNETEVPMNRRWSDTEAAVLKHWAEEGLTLRQMAREAPEVLGWEPSEQQLFHFFHYRKIPLSEGEGRQTVKDLGEMEEFMLKNYLKPLNRLWREFKEEFGEEFSRQEVYRLQYRTAEKVQQKQVKLTKLSMEWERLRATLSPTGRVATKHWLWRYLPLNENRQTSGVMFRTGG